MTRPLVDGIRWCRDI